MDEYDVIIVAQTNFPNDGAVGNHVRRIIRGLQSTGMSPLVLATHSCTRSPEPILSGVDRTWSIPYRTVLQRRNRLFPVIMLSKAGTKIAAELKFIIQKCRVKTVLFHGFSNSFMKKMFDLCNQFGVSAVPYLVEYFSPNVLTVANMLYFDAMWYIRKTIPKSSGIIGISTFWQTIADKHGLPYITVPSYLPDTLDKLKKAVPVVRDPGFFHIVTIGRWVRRELPMMLLQAILELVHRGIDVHYTAIGNIGNLPTERQVMRCISRDHVLQKLVTITGWISNEKKEQLLESASVFVLLRGESRETMALFPTRLPEYLIYGRPVVLSQTGDWPRYLQGNEHVMYIPPGNSVRKLVDALEAIARNPQKAAIMGEAGRQRAFEVFSIELHGKQMSKFIEQLVC